MSQQKCSIKKIPVFNNNYSEVLNKVMYLDRDGFVWCKKWKTGRRPSIYRFLMEKGFLLKRYLFNWKNCWQWNWKKCLRKKKDTTEKKHDLWTTKIMNERMEICNSIFKDKFDFKITLPSGNEDNIYN